jgi:Dolichyl-phosphate-mannose-protein mannosyltransferase
MSEGFPESTDQSDTRFGVVQSSDGRKIEQIPPLCFRVVAEPSANETSLDWRDAAIGAGILALALLARLHFLLASSDSAWPHSAWFEGDAPLWADWAGAISLGRAFEHGLALHSPGAAYFLQFILRCTGPGNFLAAKAAWCFLSALGCALTYIAARAELPRRAAAIAAVFLAFSFSSYVLATSLNGEALYSLFLPLIVVVSLRLVRRPSWMGAAALGVASGEAMLVRPEHLLLIAALIGWIAWKRRDALGSFGSGVCAAGQLALVAITAIAVCLPWSIMTARATASFNTVAPTIQFERLQPPWTADARAMIESLPAYARADNVQFLATLASQQHLAQVTADVVRSYFRQFGSTPEPLAEWHLVSGQGPLSFALANHPAATGGFSQAALDQRFGPNLKFSLPPHVYLYSHGYTAAIGWIREDPGRWAKLVGRKLEIFLDGATQGLTSRNIPLGQVGERRAVDIFTARSPAWPAWALILGAFFGLGGAVTLVKRKCVPWILIIMYKVVVTAAFFGYARQSASILPAFAVLAGAGLDAALGLLASRVRVAQRIPAWPGSMVWVIAVAALLWSDLSLTSVDERPGTAAAIAPAPGRGSGAWESAQDVMLRPAP